MNKEELQRIGIKYIINAASEDVDCFYPELFKYTELPIEDTHEGEPNQYFEQIFELLTAVKEEKSAALIHCTLGKNIAPTLCVAYMLMAAKHGNKHLPLKQAISHIQGKNIGIVISDQFLNQLIDLEDQLFDETSMKPKGRVQRMVSGRGDRGGRGGRGGKGKRGK